MNSSSRAIAQARAKRAGDNNPPPVSGNRPGTRPNTSINSASSFNGPRLPPRGPPQNQRQPNQRPQPNQFIQQPQYGVPQYGVPQYGGPQYGGPQYEQSLQAQPSLPFTKLSMADAIGLITLRLGRVEKFMIDLENEENMKEETVNTSQIDNTVLTGLLNRIEALERKEPQSLSSEISNQINEINDKQEVAFKNINDEINRNKTVITKHEGEIFKLNRIVTEIGDNFKSFVNRYDYFVKDTTDKFGDFEFAIAEIEKTINFTEPEEILPNVENITSLEDIDASFNEQPDIDLVTNEISGINLKNLVENEINI